MGAGLEAFFLNPAGGVGVEFGGVLESELVLDAGAIGFDGGISKVECGSDLAGVKAAADHLEDFEFAVGKAVDAGARGGCGAPLGKEAAGDAFAQEDFALEDASEGGEEGGAGLVFGNVPTAARAQDAFGVEVFVVHGENEHRCLEAAGLEVFDEFEAAGTAEGEVDDGDVWLEGFGHLDGIADIVGLAADGELGISAEHLSEPFPEHLVVFNQKHSSCGGRLLAFGNGRLGRFHRGGF
jgi:hypothetical protein